MNTIIKILTIFILGFIVLIIVNLLVCAHHVHETIAL